MADELDMIAAEAAALEADTAPAIPGEFGQTAQAAPMADPAQEWRDAAAMGCGMVVAMYPELKADWNEQRMADLGNALHRCAERYGWTVGGLFGHPLVGLAVATWPLGVSLARVAKERAEAAKRERAKAGEVTAASAVTDRPGVMSEAASA